MLEKELNYPQWLAERGCVVGELETGCLCSVRNGDQDISKANPAAAEAFLGNFKIKWRELKNFLPLWSQVFPSVRRKLEI